MPTPGNIDQGPEEIPAIFQGWVVLLHGPTSPSVRDRFHIEITGVYARRFSVVESRRGIRSGHRFF